MPVDFKDFYKYVTSGNFDRRNAIVMDENSADKFKVSTSDKSWAITRSDSDKKLNNDMRSAFYNAVSAKFNGNIPENVLTALNIGDFKFKANGIADSGKPLTAYRMKQVFVAMSEAGIEMPRNLIFDAEPQLDVDDGVQEQPNKSVNIGNSESIQILINDIGQEAKANDVNDVNDGAPVERDNVKVLKKFLGHSSIDKILAKIPERFHAEARQKIEAALQVPQNNLFEAMIDACRFLNRAKFIEAFENDQNFIDWREMYIHPDFRDNVNISNRFDKLSEQVAYNFMDQWIAHDTEHANKPLRPKFIQEQYILFFVKTAPQLEEQFNLTGYLDYEGSTL